MQIRKIKYKLSLLKLKLYYKQLLNICYLLNNNKKFAFVLFNKQGYTPLYFDENSFFFPYQLKFEYAKLNIKVYKYLLKKKFFAIYSLTNYNILYNFNYILQIEYSFFFDKIFLFNLKNLNGLYFNFFYIKLPFFFKLVSIDFLNNLLDKVKLSEMYLKLLKLLLLQRILLLKNLAFICLKQNTLFFPLK